MMEWIKLEIGNLPEHEVLAANFAKGTSGYKEKNLGYLFDDGEMISCDATELLENCTHYIDINKNSGLHLQRVSVAKHPLPRPLECWNKAREMECGEYIEWHLEKERGNAR